MPFFTEKRVSVRLILLNGDFQNLTKAFIGSVIFNILFDKQTPFFLPSERTFFPAYNNYIQLASSSINQLTTLYLVEFINGILNMLLIKNQIFMVHPYKAVFEIDFEDFFDNDYEFENAQYSKELSLPNILK